MNDLRFIVKIQNNLLWQRCKEVFGENITQGQAAENIGMGGGTFGRFLNFKTSPVTISESNYADKDRPVLVGKLHWTKTAIKIAVALGVRPEEIFPPFSWNARHKNIYEIQTSSEFIQEALYGEDVATPLENYERGELRDNIMKLLDELEPREKEAIVLYYGLDGNGKRTLDEVADETGRSTRERVRQIVAKGLRRLRHPSRTELLKDYWEEM